MWRVCLCLQFHILTPFQNVFGGFVQSSWMVVFKVIAKCCGFYELMTTLLALILSSEEENPLQLEIIGFQIFKISAWKNRTTVHWKLVDIKLFRDLISYLSEWSTGMYLPLRRMGKFWQRPSDIIDRCRSLFHMEIFTSQIFLFLMMETQIQYLPQFHILKYLFFQ